MKYDSIRFDRKTLATAIARVKASKTPTIFWDSGYGYPNHRFGMRVGKTGKAVFVVRYGKKENGKMVTRSDTVCETVAAFLASDPGDRDINAVRADANAFVQFAQRGDLREKTKLTFRQVAESYWKDLEHTGALAEKRGDTTVRDMHRRIDQAANFWGDKAVADLGHEDGQAFLAHVIETAIANGASGAQDIQTIMRHYVRHGDAEDTMAKIAENDEAVLSQFGHRPTSLALEECSHVSHGHVGVYGAAFAKTHLFSADCFRAARSLDRFLAE